MTSTDTLHSVFDIVNLLQCVRYETAGPGSVMQTLPMILPRNEVDVNITGAAQKIPPFDMKGETGRMVTVVCFSAKKRRNDFNGVCT